MTFSEKEMAEMMARYEARKKREGEYYAHLNAVADVVRKERREAYRLAAEEERELRERADAEREAHYANYYEAVKKANETRKARREAKTERMSERERRCRIKWAELVDDPVTVWRQERWERRQTIRAMRATGLTLAQVGERLNLSRERVRQIEFRAERDISKRAPVEAYFAKAQVAAAASLPRKREAIKTLDAFIYASDRDWLLVGSAA